MLARLTLLGAVGFAAVLAAFSINGDQAGGQTPAAPPPVTPAAAAPAIEKPTEPLALGAFTMFEKHCAHCHQVGRTGSRKPSKNFGNVLQLEEMVRDPHLILPGNPDGSPLFVRIAKQDMPYDVFQEMSGGPEPSKEEVTAVYDWIKSLDPAKVAACKDRTPIGSREIVDAIAADLDRQIEHRRRGMRYLTLTHLYNACADEKEMARYRQGAVKLLNSLSLESDVLRMRTIDKDRLIIAFNLDDLKWSEADWNRVLAVYPYGVKPDTVKYNTLVALTYSPLIWVRADWFAFQASRPPLYYDLLKMPTTFQHLQRQLGVDVDRNIAEFRAKRAGFQDSGVSKHNRLIERHTISTGYFWTSYDFKGDAPPQSLFVRPLGPGGRDGFVPDGGETIFSLPNGFQAYYLNTADGARLDKGPTEIVLDDRQLDRSVTNGISCFGCHNQGIRIKKDEIREHVMADRSFPKHVRDAVAALYPPAHDMDQLFSQDFGSFRAAMLRAGLDPNLDDTAAGIESINFLSKYYEKAIDARVAAAEYGVTLKQLDEGLTAVGGDAFRTKRRLEQGVLPRETFEAEFVRFVGNVTDDEALDLRHLAVAGAYQQPGKTPPGAAYQPAAAPVAAYKVAPVGNKTIAQTHSFDLSLISDRSYYTVGDNPVFSVRTSADCHLTLIATDAHGKATVLFPNKFMQANFLRAGSSLTFPAPDAPFQFRMNDAGTETVVALCNAGGKTSDGIRHEFDKKSFTDLGNYKDYLTRQIVIEGRKKVETFSKLPRTDVPRLPSEIVARTAIVLQVK